MKLSLKSVARNFMEGLDTRVEHVAMYNFVSGKKKYNMSKKYKNIVGTQDISWVRVYVYGGHYYDFITSSLTYFITEKTFIILMNNDAELIDSQYIAKMIYELMGSEKDLQKLTADNVLKEYWIKSQREMRVASHELEEFYSIASQEKISRLNLQDTYMHGKNQLEKRYILDIMARQIIKENKQEVLNLL